MKRIMSEELSFLYGVKERSKSFKLYKIEDGGLLIIEKKYFLSVCYRKKIHKFDKILEAEDFLIQNTSGFTKIKIPNID